MQSTSVSAYVQAHRQRFLNELKDLIRFPTISSQPKHASDLERCAAWLAQHLREIGMRNVRIFQTPGHPLVYADWLGAPSKPTVLIYGHYDVQPVDPLGQWLSPPFEPAIRNNNIYGRGSSDDKGQVFIHIKAVEACLRSSGRLPLNVKFLLDGEEEIGSPNLPAFIKANRSALSSDVAVMSDTRMLGPDRPALTYALRGGLNLEIRLQGPKTDLHSGTFGGAIHNPLQALCEMIAKLHDADRRIAIPGFYDRVRQWPPEELAYMARTGPSDEKILAAAKTEKGWGERGFSLYERTTIRPSFSVSGITGGYQGQGVKAVIPSHATAKLNFRLVPDQKPIEIENLVRQHLASITPPTTSLKIRTFLRANPALIDRNLPAMHAAARAYRHGFNAAPVFLRSGGTIPVVNTLQEVLNLPTVLMGFALPDDRMHAPNEKFSLTNFFQGIATSIAFLEETAKLSTVRHVTAKARGL